MQYKSFMEKLKGKQHKIDKNKNGQIDAQDFKILQKEDLSEAQVSTKKYSWGTMKTIHHGSDFSIPLHPEHHTEIAKLKDEQEHKFKTEDGKHWTARRKGDDVHFQGANNGGTTKVPHATMQEAYHSDTHGAVGSDPMYTTTRKYGSPSPLAIERIKKLKAKEEKDRANGTGNYKKQTQSQRDVYVKNQMSALKHIGEEAKDEKEYGYEGDMAMNQLKTLVRCAEMIEDCLKPDTDLPEWVQSKITLATDYIQTAADYLYSENEVNEQAPVAPVPDRKYIKGTPENKALRAKNKPINGHPTNVKEEAEQVEEGDLTVRTLYNKFADAHGNGHDTKSTEKVIKKVHGDVVMGHMKKAARANARTDFDGEDRHFHNAQTAAKKTDRIGGTVGRGRSEFMRKRREWSEEVELSENAPFKKLEHAVAYATDKVKTHRDDLDGIEVYKHKAGGYDVNHTMNSSGRNSLNKTGAKHLGTVYKDKPANIKEEGFFHMVGRKQIAAAKGAIKGFKEQTDLTEQDRESDDYSRRHTVVAHVSDNTGHPADGEKFPIERKALSILAATPKHAEKAAHKHFSDKGYKVHKLSAVISKNAPAMRKEDLDEAREFASYDEAESAAKPGQKPKLNPATNKYNLVSEGAIPKGGLDVSKVAHAGDKPHDEDWTTVQKKKNIPFDGPYNKSSFKKKNNPNRTGSDAARALAQRGMPKEETEGNPMKSYAEFVQDLQEIKLADLPSRKVTGTSYGAQYHDPEGDDDADNKKPAKAADAPKRGRGRPAGAMSGARQQGSAKQRKTGGVDYTGYKLHLPNNNK